MPRVVIATDKFMTNVDQKANALSRSIAANDKTVDLITKQTIVKPDGPLTDARAVELDTTYGPNL